MQQVPPQDQLNETVANLLRLHQQMNATHIQPQQPPFASMNMNNDNSNFIINNVFNTLMGGGYVNRETRGGNDLLSLVMNDHQRSLDSSTSAAAQPTTDTQHLQHQRSSANNDSSPIMVMLTQILQHHHDQQRQELRQRQQLEMHILQQIQNSSDQQQHLMLLLQLFAGQRQQNQAPEPQDSSSQIADSSNLLDTQGILEEYIRSQGNSLQVNNSNHPDGGMQGAIQLQLLQLLASQQTDNHAHQDFSHTGNRQDSNARGPSIPSYSEELLELMAQQWRQMQNNSASLVLASPHRELERLSSSAMGAPLIRDVVNQAVSDPRNLSASTTSGNVGSTRNYSTTQATPNAFTARAPENQAMPSAEDAAHMQQQLLTEALKAASNSSPTETPPLAAGVFSLEDLKYAFPDTAFDNRDSNGRAMNLPALLVMEDDQSQLSAYQTLLRYQIEVFRATEKDAATHQRGRNKPIRVSQIGVRCRHCSRLPISERTRGSSYFPSSVAGVYQAGQNMNSAHFLRGGCVEMGEPLRRQFAALANIKSTSTGAGRAYWAAQAKTLGLEDNEEVGGIRFWCDTKTA
jgi:hypothetical protein